MAPAQRKSSRENAPPLPAVTRDIPLLDDSASLIPSLTVASKLRNEPTSTFRPFFPRMMALVPLVVVTTIVRSRTTSPLNSRGEFPNWNPFGLFPFLSPAKIAPCFLASDRAPLRVDTGSTAFAPFARAVTIEELHLARLWLRLCRLSRPQVGSSCSQFPGER